MLKVNFLFDRYSVIALATECSVLMHGKTNLSLMKDNLFCPLTL
jgi:hypothetical protein